MGRLVAFICLSVSLSGCGIAEGVLAFYGLPLSESTPQALSEKLRPHDRWFIPEGAADDARFPAVIAVPGCLGTQPFHITWAEFLQQNGFVVLLIESFAARGLTTVAAMEGSCEGEHTWGFERAGDVLVSLEHLRSHPQVDGERLHLIGWSHGGWAVMDAVAVGHVNIPPPMLTELPENALGGVQSVAALYPYCEFGSYTRSFGWADDIQGVLFLAANDQNIDPQPCQKLVADETLLGRPLQQQTYTADHWFDNPEGADLVPHAYNSVATEDVRERLRTLLLAGVGDTPS